MGLLAWTALGVALAGQPDVVGDGERPSVGAPTVASGVSASGASGSGASASGGPASEDSPGGASSRGDPPKRSRARWGGYGLPVVNANSTDGFGVGLAGELFKRPASQEHGYTFKLTLSVLATIPPNYVSLYGQAEVRGRVTQLYRFGYQEWRNLPYAGAGGEAVATLRSDDEERKNEISGPYFFGAVAKPIGGSWRGYAQAYLHPTAVDAHPGGLLDTQRPFGSSGGLYADITAGAEFDSTDRWPLPVSGTRAEIDVRGGATWAPEETAPIAGIHAEHIRWQRVGSDRVVVGTRLVVEKSIGRRPMMEQFVTGGRWRDEIGFEQALAGYGRIRTRGDGLVAAAVELRPELFAYKRGAFDVELSLSAFAEIGWLFQGNDPGPLLPTIGFGPEILWQKGSQIRPFVAWGWMSQTPGGPREPQMLFGVATLDPL